MHLSDLMAETRDRSALGYIVLDITLLCVPCGLSMINRRVLNRSKVVSLKVMCS